MNNITSQNKTTVEIKKLRGDITVLTSAVTLAGVGASDTTLAEQQLQTTELQSIEVNTAATTTAISNLKNINVAQQDNAELDAFGKRRVSSGFTLIDLKQTQDNLPLFIDQEISGAGASAVHSVTNACTTLVTTSIGEYVIAKTLQRFPYLSGKSQDIKMTFSGFGLQTGVDKIIGYYDSSITTPWTANFDGLMLWNDGTTVSLRIYKSGTLTSKTDQVDWDDPLDGTGPSGITIDWDKSHIFDFDFQWLGVGRVRWNLVVDGKVVPLLTSNHANNLADVYMSNPNHSLRWEIRQNGATTGSFNYICAAVETEGGETHIGKHYGVDNGTTSVSCPSVGVTYALVGIRLKAVTLSSHIDLEYIEILAATNDRLRWELRMNPTVAGTFTYVDVTNTGIQKATGIVTNTVTGGFIMACGYAEKDAKLDKAIETIIRLGAQIDGTQDQLVLTVTPISSNAQVFGAINVQELN